MPKNFTLIDGHLSDPEAVELAKESLALAKSAPEMLLLAILIEKKVCTYADYEAMLRRLAEQFVHTLAKLQGIHPKGDPIVDEQATEDVITADLLSFLNNL